MKKRTPLGTRLYRQSTLLACLILIASAISSIVHYQNEKKPILLYAFFSILYKVELKRYYKCKGKNSFRHNVQDIITNVSSIGRG